MLYLFNKAKLCNAMGRINCHTHTGIPILHAFIILLLLLILATHEYSGQPTGRRRRRRNARTPTRSTLEKLLMGDGEKGTCRVMTLFAVVTVVGIILLLLGAIFMDQARDNHDDSGNSGGIIMCSLAIGI